MGHDTLITLHRAACHHALTGEGREDLRERIARAEGTVLGDAVGWAVAQERPRATLAMVLADMPFLPELAVGAVADTLRGARRAHFKGKERELSAWKVGFALEAAVDVLLRAPEAGAPLIEPIEAWIETLATERDCDLGRVDVLRDRMMPCWGISTKLPGRGGGWTCVAARPGRVTYPLLRYVEAGLRRPAPGARSDEAVVEMASASLRCFDEDLMWSGGEANLRRPIKDDHEVLNHTLSWARALLVLSELTGDAETRRVVDGAAAFFRASLIEEPGGLPAWAYQPSFEDRRCQFPSEIWKANHDLGFVAECHRRGVAFDAADMERFARVLTEVVLAPGFANATVSRLRPAPLAVEAAGPGNYGASLCGWNVLGAARPEVEPAIAVAMAGNPGVVPRFWMTSPRALSAYCRRPGLDALDPAFPEVAEAYRLGRPVTR